MDVAPRAWEQARDVAEDVDAGGELRVVKRCLRKALAMEEWQKDRFVELIEGLVVTTSRLMHHGSLLATHYVLDLMDRGRAPTDALLTDQTFYRQCMSYSKSSTPSGAYPEIKAFADLHRGLTPDTPAVPNDGGCINAAARKLKANVLTMLSHRFTQRVALAVRASFPNAPKPIQRAVADRVRGIPSSTSSALGLREWQFIDAVRYTVFGGGDAWEASVESAVYGCRGVKKAARLAVLSALVRGTRPPAGTLKRGSSGDKMVSHVLAFLPLCREAGGSLSEARVEAAVRAQMPSSCREETVAAVVRDVLRSENQAPAAYKSLVQSARSMLVHGKRITVSWLKRHPGNALAAVHRMLAVVEEARAQQELEWERAKPEGRSLRRLRLFPLLPVYGQRRQMVSLDAITLTYLCKQAGLLAPGAKPDKMDADFRRSLFRVPKGFPMSDNASVETDGVAVVLRVEKQTRMSEARDASAEDFRCEDFDRALFNDPGVKQVATVIEWKRRRPGPMRQAGKLTGASFRLTSKEYYASAGIDRRMAERRRRDAAISGQMETLRQASLKTASVEEFRASLASRRTVVEDVWKHKLARWTSMMDMAGYAGRRRAVDRFWRHKVGLEKCWKESRTLVVFGDGRFSATAGRQRAVPRRAMEASASRFAAKVLKVDERYTTKVCSECHQPTDPVRDTRTFRRRDGTEVRRSVEVQALRRCSSNACRAKPVKQRDLDAAKSIFQVFRAGERRPRCYTREGYDERMRRRQEATR